MAADDNKKLHSLIDQMGLTQKKRVTFHARLGDGNETLLVTGPDGSVRAGYAWALVQFGDETGAGLRVVRNRTVSEQYGLPVLVSYGVDGQLEVIGEDATLAEYFTGYYAASGVARHSANHSLYGSDPVFISGTQVLPGLVHPNESGTDLTVTVEPFHFVHGGTQYYFSGETVDLTSYVPTGADGDQCLVIVCHDPAINAATVYAGASGIQLLTGEDTMPFTGIDVESIDCSGDNRLAAVRLYYGQTEVRWSDWCDDLRNMGIGVATGLVHSDLTGLDADDHTQYALLAGRSAGQTLNGGTGAQEDLIVQSTAHADGGTVIIRGRANQSENILSIQDSTPSALAYFDSSGRLYATSTMGSSGTSKINGWGYAASISANTSGGTDEAFGSNYEAFVFNSGDNSFCGAVSIDLMKDSGLTDGSYIEAALYTDSAGKPGSAVSAFRSRVYAIYMSSSSYTTYTFRLAASISVSTDYWVVFRKSTSGGNFNFNVTTDTDTWAYSSDALSWTNENKKPVYTVYADNTMGVYGYSGSSYGVYGTSVCNYGVLGSSSTRAGVYATSEHDYAVYAEAYGHRGGVYSFTEGGYSLEGYGPIYTDQYLDIDEGVTPSSPPTGRGRYYVSSVDSRAHFVTDGGKDYDLTDWYHGIESSGALSFNDTSHVLTIAAATNVYWYKGTRYTTSSAIECDLDDYITLAANVLYYVSFTDASGVLSASAEPWSLRDNVPVATVWWNGSSGAVCREIHNHTRDLDWHTNAHFTIGTRYYSGLSLTYPDSSHDNQLQVEVGSIYDEDLASDITQQTNCRIVYKTDATTYTWINSSLPYADDAGTPAYLDTDTYSITAMTNSQYAPMWIYATPDIGRAIYIVPLHASAPYTTVAAARDATPPALSGLNINPEIKLLYRVIYRGNGSFEESTDYRTSSSLPGGGTASTTASAVSFTPYGEISSTTVQGAIQELDDEKASDADFVGDSGAGGVHGLVPAPSAGDAAAGKYLSADGSWDVPSGSGSDTEFCNVRLTLETGVAVSTTDQTAKTEVYLTPYRGNLLSIYDGAGWSAETLSSDISIKLTDTQNGVTVNGNPQITGLTDTSQLIVGMKVSGTGVAANSTIATVDSVTAVTLNNNCTADGTSAITFKVAADQVLDVFVIESSGLKLRMVAWSNSTTRATSLALQDGRYVLSGSETWRYVGTVCTTATDGQTEKSSSQCLIYNVYNRVKHIIRCSDDTNTWNYTTATHRAANNNTTIGTGRVAFVSGLHEDTITADNVSAAANSASTVVATGGIGIDSTSANSAQVNIGYASYPTSSGFYAALLSKYSGYPGTGYHYIQRLEYSGATGTTTWIGDNGIAGTIIQTGLTAEVWY